jgi:SAM-dependent methyltransferase
MIRLEQTRALINAIVRRDPSHLSKRVLSRLIAIYDNTGNRVCPCCNYTVRMFRSYGNPPRPNAMCPNCGSLERHRLLLLYLRNRTKLFSANLRLLHLAPEDCLTEIFSKAPNLCYVGSDINAKERPLAMTRADITRLPFENGCFDVILCVMVLEHIVNDVGAMMELFRVLKPSGWAIVQVNIDETRLNTFEDPTIVLPEEREAAFGQHDHVRIYGRDYKPRLESVGFVVKIDPYAKELPVDVADRYGLDREENIYLLAKKSLEGIA